METINEWIVWLNDGYWKFLVIPLLVLLSVYFTFRLGAVQVRMIPEMVRQMRSNPEVAPDGKRAVSSFGAFSISAAARVGTGNIVGVAGAIAIGGPGAVLWMWIMGVLVGAASFVESTLGQLYKERDRTGYRGGPAYYMEKGLGARWAGVIFAIAIIVTFSLTFTATQSNSIAEAISTSVAIAGTGELVADAAILSTSVKLLVGVAIVGTSALVVLGGVRRIAHVAQALVPFMALAYIVLGLIVVALNVDQIPRVFTEIVQGAFGIEEFGGAAVGTAIVQGVRRGMFSNEAGLGSAPNAGATASVTHPAKQGLVQTLGVFVDTLIICSITAFVIVVSNPSYGDEDLGPVLTQGALLDSLGVWAVHAITAILLLLCFTSVLGNYYYGEANVYFLARGEPGRALLGFQFIFLAAAFLGSVGTVEIIWNLADTTMGLMAVVNLLALAPLTGVVVLVLRDYRDQLRQGIDPVFTRDRLPQLRGVECWEPGEETTTRT
ncbi:AGCS family alanine or glycine:cation symporter [Lipingzhangella halophila]|uniref:AGCS family alanine or glycine:cation symporter n=1 Tax=Lipingzhangella halophila TaxID=1783352 RepID=A0A7W7RP73_9ACTN|nr:alanine/glycine:cation symporter family protein [Lipingzhangella halophila]MBB4935093.1 AGCS family alanine or glycine:cation symporter [Lipingzhangella halophila]